jgi:hypothetical protein
MKLERDDSAFASFPTWSKDFGARGHLSLRRDPDTGEPLLMLQPAHNVGDPVPKPQIYRIVF